MSRVANRGPLGQRRHAPARFSNAERLYYRWLHSFGQCCLTGRSDIELAHTGDLTAGKALGRKSPVWTVLPLARDVHHYEERHRAEFWASVGIDDHLAWAERLYDIFKAKDDPTALFLDMQEKANRGYLAGILGAQ